MFTKASPTNQFPKMLTVWTAGFFNDRVLNILTSCPFYTQVQNIFHKKKSLQNTDIFPSSIKRFLIESIILLHPV